MPNLKHSQLVGDDKWFVFVRMLIAVAMLSGMAMSLNLWIGERLLPRLPIVNFVVPDWLASLSTFLFVAAVIMMSLARSCAWPIIVLSLGLVLIILDQLRLQPWVYLYLFMTVPFVFVPRERQLISIYFLILVSGIYWWSGFHKLNEHFLDGNYSQWVSFFLDHKIESKSDSVRLMGYGIGAIEMTIGAGLLIQQTRKTMVIAATVMHFLIITFLLFQTEFGDSIVIPWNFAMIVLLWLVFFPLRTSIGSIVNARYGNIMLSALAVLLFWICPLLNLFGKWDHFLSFSLYSNKFPLFYVAIQDDEVAKIDDRLKRFFVSVPGMSGGKILDIYWWSKDELNVPFYPESRIFRQLSSYFCDLGLPEGRVVFLEIRTTESAEKRVKSFDCGSNE